MKYIDAYCRFIFLIEIGKTENRDRIKFPKSQVFDDYFQSVYHNPGNARATFFLCKWMGHMEFTTHGASNVSLTSFDRAGHQQWGDLDLLNVHGFGGFVLYPRHNRPLFLSAETSAIGTCVMAGCPFLGSTTRLRRS